LKRSKTLDKISYVISQYHPVSHGDKELAEAILDWVEEEGMKPPTRFVKNDNVVFPGDEFSHKLAEWEPEDDKT
jgi:hypothetical protein